MSDIARPSFAEQVALLGEAQEEILTELAGATNVLQKAVDAVVGNEVLWPEPHDRDARLDVITGTRPVIKLTRLTVDLDQSEIRGYGIVFLGDEPEDHRYLADVGTILILADSDIPPRIDSNWWNRFTDEDLMVVHGLALSLADRRYTDLPNLSLDLVSIGPQPTRET